MIKNLKKIYTLDDLVPIVNKLQSKKNKIVFTNGCFDIIHSGHTRYLFEARKAGDYLVIAVNSDQSVSTLKGSSRPINCLEERMEILSCLYFVDYVFSFSELDPCNVLRKLRPDILIKGGDWSIDKVVGKEIVESYGGGVFTIPEVKGRSTTGVVERILNKN